MRSPSSPTAELRDLDDVIFHGAVHCCSIEATATALHLRRRQGRRVHVASVTR